MIQLGKAVLMITVVTCIISEIILFKALIIVVAAVVVVTHSVAIFLCLTFPSYYVSHYVII